MQRTLRLLIPELRKSDELTYFKRKKYSTNLGFNDLFLFAYRKFVLNRINKKKTAKACINDYINIMMEAVLDGQEVEFPGGLKISVRKEPLEKPKKWQNSKVIANEGQEYCYNPNRMGFNYFFHCEWDRAKKAGAKIYLSDKWRGKLNLILRTTDKDYPMYHEHTEKG